MSALFLLIPPAAAPSYPVDIAFGRSWPLSIVVDASRGVAYVDATSGDYPPTGYSFGVINVSSHQVSEVLGLNQVPGPLALDESTGDVYVAGNESVGVFIRSSNDFGTPIEVGAPVLNIAFDSDASRYLYVAAGDEVIAFDPTSGMARLRATLQGGPEGMAIDSKNGMLYVSSFRTAEIVVLNASTLSPVGRIELPACCASQLAFDSRTDALFGTTRGSQVFVVDLGSGGSTKRVTVAPGASNSTNEIAIDAENGRVYVASSPGGSVVELDGEGKVIGAFKAENQVAGLAVDEKTRELFATNYHQISVFPTARGGVMLMALAVGGAIIVVALVAMYAIWERRDRGQRRSQSGMSAGSG